MDFMVLTVREKEGSIFMKSVQKFKTSNRLRADHCMLRRILSEHCDAEHWSVIVA